MLQNCKLNGIIHGSKQNCRQASHNIICGLSPELSEIQQHYEGMERRTQEQEDVGKMPTTL